MTLLHKGSEATADLVQSIKVIAPGLGVIRPAAASAAEDLTEFLTDIARVESLGLTGESHQQLSPIPGPVDQKHSSPFQTIPYFV
jgi:hypothetical protein